MSELASFIIALISFTIILDGNHIARKNPLFEGNIYLSMAMYQGLDAGSIILLAVPTSTSFRFDVFSIEL